MKKFIVLLVVCMFLFSSTFSTFAKEDNPGKNKGKSKTSYQLKEADDDGSKKSLKNLNKVAELKQLRTKDVKTYMERLRETKSERLEAAKKRSSELKEFASIAKKACRRKSDTTQCDEALGKINGHLMNIVDRLSEAFTNIKTKLEDADVEDKVDAVDKIEEYLEELELIKAELESAITSQEIKKIADQLRKKVMEYKKFLNGQNKKVYWGRIRGMLNKAENTKNKLKKLVGRLERTGVAVEKVERIETLLAEIDEKIEAVRLSVELEKKEGIKEALGELHEFLKTVVKQFGELGRFNMVREQLKIREREEIKNVEPQPIPEDEQEEDEDEEDDEEEEDDE